MPDHKEKAKRLLEKAKELEAAKQKKPTFIKQGVSGNIIENKNRWG